MHKRQIRLVLLLLASFFIVGCPSNPPPEPVPDDTTAPSPKPKPKPASPKPAPPPPAFSSKLEPYYPGDMNRLVERVFFFDFDQAVLNRADLQVLQIHTRVLKENPERRVLVEGHCDERGTREYNLALGESRAQAVASFLIASGVPSSRIESVSYGEERPDDPGHGEAAWSRNRRAVLIYR